jgi:diguanylate cyclase (GGDEF)-like protein/PAS domain S-box-containing protein
MSGQSRISLKWIWILSVALAVVVPISLMMGWYAYSSYKEKLNYALFAEQLANEKLTDQLSAEVSRLVTLLVNKSDYLSFLLEKGTGAKNLENIYKLLDFIDDREHSVTGLMVLGKEGELTAVIESRIGVTGKVTLSAERIEFMQRHWGFDSRYNYPEFVIPMAGKVYIGQPEIHGDFFAINIAVPVGNSPQGVLIAELNIAKLWSSFIKEENGVGVVITRDYILDSRGSLLNTIEDSDYEPGDLMTNLAIARTALINAEWPLEKSYIGVVNKKVYGTKTSVPLLNWTLVSEVIVSEVTRDIWRSVASIFLFSLSVMIASVCIALILIRKTSKSLQQATIAIKHVAEGDYSHSLKPCGIRELDMMSTGINSMARSRQSAEEALKNSEAKYRLVHDTAFDAIIIADMEGSIVECNKSTDKIFGYVDGELIGRSLMELLIEEVRERMAAEILRLSETGNVKNQERVVELHGLRKDGGVFPIELAITSFELREAPLLTMTIRDITEKKVSEESIKHMAYHDHLTGLPNRLLFIDRLDQALHREAWRKRNVAVLFLDLNRFKIINDTLGHAFGDKLLKVVAERLEECLREGDTVARQGGDEFTVILQDMASIDDIPMVLEKILDAIKQPILIDGEELTVGTSIGVSVFPNDGADSDTLLKNADTAMYRAKAEGKSGFQIYSQAMSIKATERLKMEHKLSKALDNEEFVVHYQPELDLKTEKIVGMETLVRLNDPSSDMLIPPGDFIPVAEETGIIIPLSEWVLRTACEQNKAWYDAGYSQMTVAVNISPKVFRQKNFPQTVVDILEETGLKPECLELEITEETMLIDAEETVETMKTLREVGVRFAIDDFGTGYSSLSYLKALPIEMIKIDRSFINDIFTSSDDKAIVTAIIQMAHSMGIEVIAEGVETQEQVNFLSSLGCDKLQGYMFSKPVPYDEFEKLLMEDSGTKKDLKDSA